MLVQQRLQPAVVSVDVFEEQSAAVFRRESRRIDDKHPDGRGQFDPMRLGRLELLLDSFPAPFGVVA